MRQEMLTRSGAPDFICLPFGWRIHFAMSFLPLLAFQPLLAKYESSMSEYMVSRVSDAFIFLPFYISMWCISMSVIVLARDGNPLRTGAVGPFLVLCLVLSYVSCTHALWFLHGRDVSLFMWCECYCYQFCQKMDSVLLEINFVCLMSDSLTAGRCLVEAFTCGLFTITGKY